MTIIVVCILLVLSNNICYRRVRVYKLYEYLQSHGRCAISGL